MQLQGRQGSSYITMSKRLQAGAPRRCEPRLNRRCKPTALQNGTSVSGCIVGRVGGRISGGRFTLDGERVKHAERGYAAAERGSQAPVLTAALSQCPIHPPTHPSHPQSRHYPFTPIYTPPSSIPPPNHPSYPPATRLQARRTSWRPVKPTTRCTAAARPTTAGSGLWRALCSRPLASRGWN